MPKQGFEKIWSAKPWTAGATIADTVRRRNVVSLYLARFKYGATVAGGTGAGAPYADAAFRLVNKAQVLVGGKPVQVFEGTDAAILEAFFNAQGKRVQVPIPDDTIGDKTGLVTELPIILFMPWSYTPDEYAMPTPILDAPSLQFDMLPDLKYLITTARDLTSVTLDAGATLDLYEQPLFDSGIAPQNHEALRIDRYSQAVTQTGKIVMTLDRLRVGDELRAAFIIARAGGASGYDYVLNDAVISDVRFLLNGLPRPETTEWAVLQNNNVADYGFASKFTGAVVIDAGRDKRTHQGELFQVQTVEKPYFEINCTKQAGDNKVDLLLLYVRRRGD